MSISVRFLNRFSESRKADTLYRNADDSVRIRIFSREDDESGKLLGYDYDIVFKDKKQEKEALRRLGTNYGVLFSSGDNPAKTRLALKKDLEKVWGVLTPMGSLDNLTKGW